jgi:anti-sigma regulatory factor (Ser/Thr protein kinase)
MHHYGKRIGTASPMLDNPGLERSVRCVEANSLAAVLPMFVKLEDWMRVLGYPRCDLVAVILATREAVLNAVRHGHRGNLDKTLRLKYLVTPTEVLVEVEDEGFGFNPDCIPDAVAGWQDHQPRGRGLFLMRSYMSWISFNPTGNRVTLCRQRSEK